MLRVGDLARSIKFFTEVLGMKLLRTCDIPEDSYTLAFLGYGSEVEGTVLELTYNYGVTSYEHGGYYGHICIEVEDIPTEVARCKEFGVQVDYQSDDGFMAFIRDPDNYQIELLNREMFRRTCSKPSS